MKFGFGARVLKTGLAVAVAMYVAMLFSHTSAVFAGIAAVFSIQPSIYRSFQTIIEQIEANLIGAISAVFMVYLFGNDPIIVGFTIILVISFCMSFKIKSEVFMVAIVPVIAIMEATDLPFHEFAFMRFASILIGIIAAFIVNLVFLPPKYETKLFKQIEEVTTEVLQWIRITSRHLSKQPALKEEVKKLVEDITMLDQTYLLYSEERTYTKKSQYERARKLVLFRQLIYSTKKSLELLRTLHRYDHELEGVPVEVRTYLIEEIDKVIHIHERLILTCKGKIREQEDEAIEEYTKAEIPSLIEKLVDTEGNIKSQLQFLPLAAKLMDYDEQLQHVRKLLATYQNYHSEEHIQTEAK
ncbi:FUSC family protein [Salirhabdus sp. Marseille-P4669]|uniref:FUSC family protein n=1 Tax=Salirhabdus sp. Marseille-P4669 TaxID=2042310 RepID=UPI000C7B17A3|nr:aromatic acid exporter family protein [Salirhabdus sp. Marseille-P4669]